MTVTEAVLIGKQRGWNAKRIAVFAGTSTASVYTLLYLERKRSGYIPTETRPITLAGPAWSVEGLPYNHKDARAA